MKNMNLKKTIFIGSFLLWPITSFAQMAPVPYHRQAYSINSGMHSSRDSVGALAAREVVRVSGAGWLQLHFGTYNLGAKSYLSITSLKDGFAQRLDANSLSQW